MHREAKNCDVSLENVAQRLAVRKPFNSHSNEMRYYRLFERLQLLQKSTSCTVQKIFCHFFEWLELSVQKVIAFRLKGSAPDLSVSRQSPNARRHNPLKKHKTASMHKININRPCFPKRVFECATNFKLIMILRPRSLALSYNCSPDIKEKSPLRDDKE